MFIELTTNGVPLIYNTQSIYAVRGLDKKERIQYPNYKTVLVLSDNSGQYVDQSYEEIKKQLFPRPDTVSSNAVTKHLRALERDLIANQTMS